MKFGLFYEWPNPELRDWRTLFDEGVEQIQSSEDLGFDYCLIAEHHFSNYGMSPSPLLQALHIGNATKRIQIATAVLVLPQWDPLRLAEEVAVLDNLIDGRFICGVGRGFQPYELMRFGVTLEDSRLRFAECLEIITKAWSSDQSFTYKGEHFDVSHPVTVWPKPKQKPYPPLWIAGTSVETMQVAAEWNMMPVTGALLGLGGVRAQLASYVHARRDLGKSYENTDLGLQCMTFVADTDEEALKAVPYARWQTRGGRALNQLRVQNGRVDAAPFEGEPDEATYAERLFVGSPDTVIAKFKKAAEMGATHVSNWMMFGGVEHEKIMRSIELMAKEVMPALRDLKPPLGLHDELAAMESVRSEDIAAMRAKGPAPSDVT